MSSQVRAALSLTILLAAACTDAGRGVSLPTDPVSPPPVLTAGSWMLTEAEGQPLPAYIAHREVDGVLEQVWVDSARLDLRADGRWTQQVFTRTHRGGAFSHVEAWIDMGVTRVHEGKYRLDSENRSRVATLDNRQAGRLEVLEQFVFWAGAGQVDARYEPLTAQPPGEPVPTTERWVAMGTSQGPLPARAYFFPNEPLDGNATEYRLDSAVVSLRNDGTYVRRTWFSEWFSPDYRAGAPYQLVYRTMDFDHGFWSRNGQAITLLSNWIENQTLGGAWEADGRLRLHQPLSPGDDRFDVFFVRE